MPNPIMGGGMPPMTPNGNPFAVLNTFLGKGGNPQQFLNMLMGKMPNANQTVQQIQNMMGNRSPKEFALQLGKQSGVNEQEILNLAQRLGAK